MRIRPLVSFMLYQTISIDTAILETAIDCVRLRYCLRRAGFRKNVGNRHSSLVPGKSCVFGKSPGPGGGRHIPKFPFLGNYTFDEVRRWALYKIDLLVRSCANARPPENTNKMMTKGGMLLPLATTQDSGNLGRSFSASVSTANSVVMKPICPETRRNV